MRRYQNSQGQWRSAPGPNTIANRVVAARKKYGDELIDWLEDNRDDKMDFVRSVAQRFAVSGNLSDKQAAALEKIRAQRDVWAEQRNRDNAQWAAMADDVQPGRYLVEGRVLSAKYKTGQFGDALKILVMINGRNEKLYGNAPKNLVETYGTDLNGKNVSFVARVKATNEKGFGVFSHANPGRIETDPVVHETGDDGMYEPEIAPPSEDRVVGSLCHDCLELVGDGCECR